jgi:hypothetical protein
MKFFKSILLAVSSFTFCLDALMAQNNFPPTGNVSIGVASPTSLLHMAGSGQLSIGTPDVANTEGAALTSNELRFRSTGNYYMALGMVPGSYEMQFVNKNNGTMGGFRADVLKVNNIYSMNNFIVGNVLDGQLKVGGQGYASTPLHVKENYSVADYFPAMIIESHKTSATGALVPLNLHLQPVNNGGTSDNVITGISFGGAVLPGNNYSTNSEAAVIVESGSSYGTKMHLATTNSFAAGAQKRLTIDHAGNVGIGTTTPDVNAKLHVSGNIFASNKIAIGTTDIAKINSYALAVNGDAIFNKAKVKLYGSWPDFVFEEKYELLPIAQLEQYIKKNKHLPNVPSATEVEKEGIDLGANQATLLLKK